MYRVCFGAYGRRKIKWSTILTQMYKLPLISIIGTIVIPIIKLIFSYSASRQNAKWHCKMKSASVDTYMKILLCLNILGAILTVTFLIALVFWNQYWNWQFTSDYIYGICSIIIGTISIFVFAKARLDLAFDISSNLKFKKLYMYIPNLLCKSAILITGIAWTFLLIYPTLSTIIVCVGCVILEILSFFFLDNKTHPEYKYVSFLFEDNTKIDKVDIRKVKQKGDWIYISLETEQLNFKVTSIKRIRYSNSILDNIMN